MGNDQNTLKTKSLAVIIVGLILLGFVVDFGIKKNREHVQAKALKTISQVTIQAFSAALVQYHKSYGAFPQVRWAEMLRVLQGESLRGQNPSNIVFLGPGRRDPAQRWAADAWGPPPTSPSGRTPSASGPAAPTKRTNKARATTSSPKTPSRKKPGGARLPPSHRACKNLPSTQTHRA